MPPHRGHPQFPMEGADGLIHTPLCYGRMNFDRFHQPRLFTLAAALSPPKQRELMVGAVAPTPPPHHVSWSMIPGPGFGATGRTQDRPMRWPTRGYHGTGLIPDCYRMMAVTKAQSKPLAHHPEDPCGPAAPCYGLGIGQPTPYPPINCWKFLLNSPNS
jgi:hypothetical protein